jgi:hypothetical protein
VLQGKGLGSRLAPSLTGNWHWADPEHCTVYSVCACVAVWGVGVAQQWVWVGRWGA